MFNFLTQNLIVKPIFKACADDRRQRDHYQAKIREQIEEKVKINDSLATVWNQTQWRETWGDLGETSPKPKPEPKLAVHVYKPKKSQEHSW